MEATNLDRPKRLNDRPSTVGNGLKSADLSLSASFGAYECECLDQDSLLAATSQQPICLLDMQFLAWLLILARILDLPPNPGRSLWSPPWDRRWTVNGFRDNDVAIIIALWVCYAVVSSAWYRSGLDGSEQGESRYLVLIAFLLLFLAGWDLYPRQCQPYSTYAYPKIIYIYPSHFILKSVSTESLAYLWAIMACCPIPLSQSPARTANLRNNSPHLSHSDSPPTSLLTTYKFQ